MSNSHRHFGHRPRIFLSASLAALLAAAAGNAEGAGLPDTLKIMDSKIVLAAPDPLPVGTVEVLQWVQRAGDAVSKFYGKYPVPEVQLFIFSDDRGAVQAGREFEGRRINISLGAETTAADLTQDWMLTHEMFHLSQPDVAADGEKSYSWMSEGMADYLEPVARIRLGQITMEKFWGDLIEGLPRGLPKADDKGLDLTPTWGRTYWGGSLYWLMADIRVRQQTHNQKSVRDAALAVLNAGGDGSQTWAIDRLLNTYDHATGTTVFSTLHNEMGEKADPVDLAELWKSLGVIPHGEQAPTFDDAAPLAEIRKGITSK